MIDYTTDLKNSEFWRCDFFGFFELHYYVIILYSYHHKQTNEI